MTIIQRWRLEDVYSRENSLYFVANSFSPTCFINWLKMQILQHISIFPKYLLTHTSRENDTHIIVVSGPTIWYHKYKQMGFTYMESWVAIMHTRALLRNMACPFSKYLLIYKSRENVTHMLRCGGSKIKIYLRHMPNQHQNCVRFFVTRLIALNIYWQKFR